MEESMPVRRLVKIYTAPSAFEATLIRRTLESEGIDCLIPGEDMHSSPTTGSEENAIFVREDERDRALELLQRAWDFFEGSGEGSDVLEDD